MARTAVQLYTFRESDRSLPSIVDHLAEVGFEGVEFAYRLADADIDAVRMAMDDNDFTAAGAHVNIEDIEGDPEATATRYARVHCDRLTVPHLPEEYFTSTDDVERAADRLSALVDQVDATIGYHNHDQEFTELHGRPAYATLIEATDPAVEFQFHVSQAADAGFDPIAFLDEHGPRITSLHVDASDPAPDVDLPAIVNAAIRNDVEWLIQEDGSTDPFENTERAAEQLHRLT